MTLVTPRYNLNRQNFMVSDLGTVVPFVKDRHVIFIHPFDAIAGSQRVAIDVVRALRACGSSVDIHLGFGTNGFISGLDDVKRFSTLNKVLLRQIFYPLWLLWMILRSTLFLSRREIIWANSIHAAPAALLGLFFSPNRVVLHIHEIKFPKIYLLFLRFAERRGAVLLCVSDYHRKALGLDARILYNCVSIGEDGVDLGSRKNLVFVGNTSPEKGFSLFLDVVSCLPGAGLKPIAYLSSKDRCDSELLARASSLGIELQFGVTDTRTMYSAAYLSLVLSDPDICSETFSLVSVESVTHLVPVGCAGMGVATEVLGDALAFDVRSRDPEILAQYVTDLWGNPDRYAALINACRVCRENYTFERFKRDVCRIADVR